jgi:hypothetical protein
MTLHNEYPDSIIVYHLKQYEQIYKKISLNVYIYTSVIIIYPYVDEICQNSFQGRHLPTLYLLSPKQMADKVKKVPWFYTGILLTLWFFKDWDVFKGSKKSINF